MSERTRKGIPTTYRGIKMRSRGEARFAAFADELGWDWEYEPMDLLAYIPDFAIHFRRGTTVVEIKSTPDDVPEARSKLELSGWHGDALIVSRAPGILYGNVWCLGDLMVADNDVIEWDKAALHLCLSCGDVTYVAPKSDWACRCCGAHDGRGHLGTFDPSEAFARATNRVQWRPAA